MNITINKRDDGMGAIYQNCLFAILWAQLKGYNYVHRPLEEVEHNYNNSPRFIQKVERLMNLQKRYEGNVDKATSLDTTFYEELEGQLDHCDFTEVKELFWANKSRDTYKNGRFNIAIHIRRPNSRDVRIEGCDTPDSYYLYIIDKLRKRYENKNPLFHIYSQGRTEEFEAIYLGSDIQFHINADQFVSFKQMVAADVLVTSASSFSYTAALLSDGMVIYCPFWHKGKKEWDGIFDFNAKRKQKRKVKMLYCTMRVALGCDYIIDNRFSDFHEKIDKIIYDKTEVERLKDGEWLFLGGTKIETFVDDIIDILSRNSVKLNIIISNIEPECDRESVMKLLPHSYMIFVSNNVIEHEQIKAIPIGLRDPYEVFSEHINFSHQAILDKMGDPQEKTELVLMCFRLDDSSSQNRKDCYEYFKDKEWIRNLNEMEFDEVNNIKQCGRVPLGEHYTWISRSKYSLCPTGYGFDTHKFQEALYLNSIPLVKKTNTAFDKLYERYPVLLVNEWNEVTEELLNENYERLYEELEDFQTNLIINNL